MRAFQNSSLQNASYCLYLWFWQYGLVHISAGDLLRAEIAAGTDNGKQAKEFMEKGALVPDEIVVNVGVFLFQHYPLM